MVTGTVLPSFLLPVDGAPQLDVTRASRMRRRGGVHRVGLLGSDAAESQTLDGFFENGRVREAIRGGARVHVSKRTTEERVAGGYPAPVT